jgi:protein-disulfide isomerase
LIERARSLKLDEGQFDWCLANGKYKAQIEEDIREGMRAGVSGTPGFFINGIWLSGAEPEAAFEKIIQAELPALESERATQ